MTLTVWRIALDNPHRADALWGYLDSTEQSRAIRFCTPELQRRYIIAHGALRLILADICSGGAVNLIVNRWGKPALAAGGAVFNLTHSGDLALCALANSGEIGVDIEAFRPGQPAERVALARRFFHPNEAAALTFMPEEQQNTAFLRYWTRKEAYIKAKGLGLSLPLQQFCVSSATAMPELISSDYCPADVGRYRLWDIKVSPGYWASLAYCGSDDSTVIYRNWDFNIKKLSLFRTRDILETRTKI